MDNSWENYEPSPIEFFHGLLMEKFHEFRLTKTENIEVMISGNELNNIIAECKLATYEKYNFMRLDKAIPKEAFNSEGFGFIHIDHTTGVDHETLNALKQAIPEGKTIVILGANHTSEMIPKIESLPDPEPLILNSIPRFEEPIPGKQKRTNHERQPASFGKRNNRRR